MPTLLPAIEPATALFLVNQGHSLRYIGEQHSVSAKTVHKALRKAIAAGGVVSKPRKMTADTFAKLTVKVWRAKQRLMARPNNRELRAILESAVAEFSKAIL